MHIHFLYSCSSILGSSATGIMTFFCFMATFPITASSTLNVQYGHMPCFMLLLVDGHPSKMYKLRSCKCILSCMDVWKSFVAMHITASLFMLMPAIFFIFMFSLILSLSQSAMYNSQENALKQLGQSCYAFLKYCD